MYDKHLSCLCRHSQSLRNNNYRWSFQTSKLSLCAPLSQNGWTSKVGGDVDARIHETSGMYGGFFRKVVVKGKLDDDDDDDKIAYGNTK